MCGCLPVKKVKIFHCALNVKLIVTGIHEITFRYNIPSLQSFKVTCLLYLYAWLDDTSRL